MSLYLKRLENGSAVGGQLGVGRLAEELREGSDGIQLVSRDLDTIKTSIEMVGGRRRGEGRGLGRAEMRMSSRLSSPLTSENLPSPNHCSHLMPWLACRLPVARQVTTIPGHQEKPLIFPHTNSPMPKPLLSCCGEKEEGKEDERKTHNLYFWIVSQGIAHIHMNSTLLTENSTHINKVIKQLYFP